MISSPAWDICSNLFSYTSHAISRECLESWPVYMMKEVLPRHLEIIYEINQRHLDSVRSRYGNPEASAAKYGIGIRELKARAKREAWS